MSQGLGEKPFCAGIYLSLADIAVGCALGYLDFRFPDIDWRGSYPNLNKLHEKLMQRASFIDTRPNNGFASPQGHPAARNNMKCGAHEKTRLCRVFSSDQTTSKNAWRFSK